MTLVERDAGLGTLYERWAIQGLLDRWFAGVPTALEGPVDGMAGMPGLHLLGLAKGGTRVTVVHPDPRARDAVRRVYRSAGCGDRLSLVSELPEAGHDLVLGFNFATHVEDWRAHLAALADRADRWVVVFATHPRSYGAWIRRGLRRLEPGPRRAEQFDHPSCEPRVMREALRRHGVVEAEAYVDCPWWPDLFVSAGQSLASASLSRFGLAGRAGPRATYDFGPEDFPFARPELPPRLARALRRHPGFDRLGGPIAGVFAHHRAFRVAVG